MQHANNANKIKHELLTRVARMCYENNLTSRIDKLIYEIYPKDKSSFRCCIHKDRAVVRYRIMAALGYAIEDETDESKQLSAYAAEAEGRSEINGSILTVIDEACSSCVRTNYYVTNACRGCVARHCIYSCPKGAIEMNEKEKHAVIDSEKCVNCSLCQKVCPYHAIIYIPVPCEEACPVQAITQGPNHKEVIDHDKCIACGKCVIDCPFSAIVERSQIVDVVKAIRSEKKVAAMFAPSIGGQFPLDLKQLSWALRSLGFDLVAEVAAGADITAQHESEEFSEKMAEGEKFMTSSCCTAFTLAVERHITELAPFVSHTKTPMHYTAEKIKRENPDVVTVFIGPCISKKYEGMNSPYVDYTISAEELWALFDAKDVDMKNPESAELDIHGSFSGREFAVSRGVSGYIKKIAGDDFRPVVINGLTRQTFRELKKMPKEGCAGNFVEVMACEGGCVGGPLTINNSRRAAKRIADLK